MGNYTRGQRPVPRATCVHSSRSRIRSPELSSRSRQDLPTLISVEEIASLELGQTTKQILRFHFHQQLAAFCNEKRYPDIHWFCIKPLSLVMDAFMDNGSY